MGAIHLFFLFYLIATSIISNAQNITKILDSHPEYSELNRYLTETKVSDEINSRQTITVLALDNAAMTALAAKHPLSVIKSALQLHVLLDYYDSAKLHQINGGTVETTTLYQTTGNADGQIGLVNITDLKGGKVGFGSAVPGSELEATYTKSVEQVPYNISVIEISQPIIVPAIMSAPAPTASDLNITVLLEKAGCKTFASLIASTGVLKMYESAVEKGLTVFAPTDEAFKSPKMPDLSKLTNAELISLLQYHALASYSPKGTLKTTKGPISTLATSAAGKYDLMVTNAGDDVSLDSGVVSSRLASTVLDVTPLVIFTVDSVLLPTELFGKSPSPAPSPAPVNAPSPKSAEAPSPAPKSAEAPSPFHSPPAPPTETPAGAPAEGPAVESPSEESSSNNAAGDVNATALFRALLTVSVSIIISVFLW